MADSLTPDQTERLRWLIIHRGLEHTAGWLELNTTTLLRAAVGLPLHNATRTVIQHKLSDHAEKQV